MPIRKEYRLDSSLLGYFILTTERTIQDHHKTFEYTIEKVHIEKKPIPISFE